jgi:hypothetical protein
MFSSRLYALHIFLILTAFNRLQDDAESEWFFPEVWPFLRGSALY